ncbi:MAG: methylated-DNA-protein-cysteine methyltransferase related protein [Clostridiales bacterium]|jgi:methylated-DNA-protein-cysteine methyltransferase-like protein|nr:methylated-DNA-protein-cysteine methyltransferase related protein [Clostridiales bacterium]
MKSSYKPFTRAVIQAIRSIPEGEVATYGDIAKACGSPNGARQVVRVLSALSEKEKLPWHRVVNKAGEVVIRGDGSFEQIIRLRSEGVLFTSENRVNMEKHRHIFK